MVLTGLHDLQRRVRRQYQTNGEVLGNDPITYTRRDKSVLPCVPCHVEFITNMDVDHNTHNRIQILQVTVDKDDLQNSQPVVRESLEHQGRKYYVTGEIVMEGHGFWTFTAQSEQLELKQLPRGGGGQ